MKTEVAWAAGLYERGGSVARQEGRKPRLQIKSNDGLVLKRFQAAVGTGFIYGPYDYEYKDGSVRKPYYVWIAEGRFAIEVVDLLSPYLSETTLMKLEDTVRDD